MREPAVEITLLPLTPITTGGSGSKVDVRFYSELLCFLEVTGVGGTSPSLNVFIDSSDDGGSTWFQLAQLGPTNINANPANNPYPATYTLGFTRGSTTALFGGFIRVRYTLTGTNPTATVQVRAVAK